MRFQFHVALFAGEDEESLWTLSLEEALSRMELLPRMFVELDGSYLWTPCSSDIIEGVLYDRCGKMVYAEMRGQCSGEHFDQLLAAFGWPGEKFRFQLLREGRFVDEAEFRRTSAIQGLLE